MEQDDLQGQSKHFDESDVKAIIELSSRFSKFAQSQSEGTKRMTAKKLNPAGKHRSKHAYKSGDQIWFYKPPSQNQAIATGRKVKHLSHYYGPATITETIGSTAVLFSFEGKT